MHPGQQHKRTPTGRSLLLQGAILAHFLLLVFFCVKAVSSTSYLRPTPRSAPTTDSSMRISTYNLRYDSMPDNITVQQSLASLADPLVVPAYLAKTGEQPWSARRIKVAQHLISEGGIIHSFQEALVRQVTDLQELLGDDWAWIGVGRDDGKTAGEFSPIFYRKSAVELRSWDTFWLSNTPFDVSRFPGAGSLRICTAARFTLKGSPAVDFALLNTHLDDQSDAQRRLGASLILYRAKYEAWLSKGGPVILTGDFNSPSTGTDSGAYNITTGVLAPEALNATFAAKYATPNGTLPGFVMDDLKGAAPRFSVGGNFATYTGFGDPDDPSPWTRIDFVFGGSNGRWTSDGFKAGTSLTDDGTLASDHRPVFADVTIE